MLTSPTQVGDKISGASRGVGETITGYSTGVGQAIGGTAASLPVRHKLSPPLPDPIPTTSNQTQGAPKTSDATKRVEQSAGNPLGLSGQASNKAPKASSTPKAKPNEVSKPKVTIPSPTSFKYEVYHANPFDRPPPPQQPPNPPPPSPPTLPKPHPQNQRALLRLYQVKAPASEAQRSRSLEALMRCPRLYPVNRNLLHTLAARLMCLSLFLVARRLLRLRLVVLGLGLLRRRGGRRELGGRTGGRGCSGYEVVVSVYEYLEIMYSVLCHCGLSGITVVESGCRFILYFSVVLHCSLHLSFCNPNRCFDSSSSFPLRGAVGPCLYHKQTSGTVAKSAQW